MPRKNAHDSLAGLPEKKLALIAAQLIRAGRMPEPGRLADAISSAGRAAEKVRVKLARAGERPYNRVFVSSSTRDNSTLPQAKAGLRSPEFEDLILASHRQPEVVGGRNGFGFWSDGVEESRMVNVADPTALDRVAASLGKAFRQKGVIHFGSGAGGSDIAHVLLIPHADVGRIADDLMRHGVEYKTIIPDHEHGRAEVHILDGGGVLAPQVEAYAREAGAHHDQHLGKATFLGGDTREEAEEVYNRVLNRK